MKPRKMNLILVSVLFLGVLSVLEFSSVAPAAASISGWETWQNWKFVNFSETMGVRRVDEPVDIFMTFDTPTPVDDIRVLDSSLNEIPSQVYNKTIDGDGNCTSANIAFLVDCPASDYVIYTVLYNNLTACQPPVYDGLRLYINTTTEEWNVTALKEGVEKSYFYRWKSSIDLYSNGKRVTWAGGPAGWNFSQFGLGTMWADAYDTPWFGASTAAIYSILNNGSLFIEMNYTEPYASDLMGTVFDFNVSTAKILRVWYQPDLNPLVSCKSSFFINPVSPLVNYTIKSPYYLDFKLANRTTQSIYQDFTWRNATGTYTVPTNTTPGVEVTDNMGGGVSPIGWWSYNGSRPDSADKPAANMGLIPTYSRGTNTTWDYTLRFTAQDYEYGNHHCSNHFRGSFNGVAGDAIETESYIVTYGSNAEPYMSNKAIKLRNPLTYKISPENQPPVPVHDVAVTNVKAFCPKEGLDPVTEGYTTWTIDVNITVENLGKWSIETFTVTANYENATGRYTIGTKSVALNPGTSTTVNFKWKPDATVQICKTYTISANASIVLGDTNTTNNYLADGTYKVKHMGDVTNDDFVDGLDLSILGLNWYRAVPPANAQADFSFDAFIDGLDLSLLGLNWYKGCP